MKEGDTDNLNRDKEIKGGEEADQIPTTDVDDLYMRSSDRAYSNKLGFKFSSQIYQNSSNSPSIHFKFISTYQLQIINQHNLFSNVNIIELREIALC